jgi:MFS family permease
MPRIASRTPTVTPWRVLAPIGLGTALSLMGDTAMYAVLPTHTAAAGVSVLSVGILLSANRWVRLLLNQAAGVAYDRWSRRWLFVAAMFVGALSTAMYALTRGFVPLLVARVLWGVAWSGIWVGGNAIVLDITTAADRGRWTGLYQLSFYLGGAIGFPAGGLLTDWLGFHNAMLVAAVVTLLGALMALWLLPETRSLSAETLTLRDAQRASEPRQPAAPAARTHSLAPVNALYGANRFVVAGVLTATLGLLVQQMWGDPGRPTLLGLGVASITGLLLGANTLISMFSAPIAGHRSDGHSGRWRVAAQGLAAGVVGFALLTAGAPALILAAIPFVAVAGGTSQSVATAMLGDQVPGERRARALGWLHTIGDLASAAAPPLAYAALPWLGLPGLYAACAALLGSMLLWALRLAPARRALEPRAP